MALVIELLKDGAAIDGTEEWWDDIAAALAATDDDYPILSTVDPHGDWTLPPAYLPDLTAECMKLARTSPERLRAILTRLADLSGRATSIGAALRFDGD